MENQNIASADWLTWDEEVDVVIIGFGGAGVCAAIEATECGASVLAVDRFEGGGATEASGGVCYAAGSRYQREAGFDDTPDEMFKYLRMEIGDVVSPFTLKRFCNESNANLEWLADKGVNFGSHFNGAKTSYPGKGVFLYYSGNELNPRYAAVARPAPRGHRVVGEGPTGKTFFARLKQAALDRGVRLWTHSPATRLITDQNGAVIGVEVNRLKEGSRAWRRHRRTYRWARMMVGAVSAQAAERFSRTLAAIEAENVSRLRIRARRGVILASGGYIFNRAMIAKEAPLYQHAAPLGTPGCDGSGIVLGRSVGGTTASMGSVCASRSIAPPIAFVEGILVNGEGNRIAAEDAYTATLGRLIAESPGGIAWLIVDKAILRRAMRQSLPGQGRLLLIHCLPSLMLIFFGSRKGATIEVLAQKCNLPADALSQTVQKYHAILDIGAQDPMGKKQEYYRQLTGPFYALDVSLRSKTAPIPTFSLGGLVVDENSGAVRRDDASTIPGLYAAGRTALGLPSNYYVSGLSLSDCVFSGRRAGRHAASANQAIAMPEMAE